MELLVVRHARAQDRDRFAATGRTDDNPVVVDGQVLTSGGSLPLDVTIFLQTAQLALEPQRSARRQRTRAPSNQRWPQ